MRNLALCIALVAAVAACGDSIRDNRPPEVAAQQVTTAEDTPISITIVASAPDGAPVALSFAPPTHGTMTKSGLTLTYTPAPDYHGADAVVVTASDGSLSATATVSITVTPVNDPPVAVDDVGAGVRNTPVNFTAATLVGNDTDVDGDVLTITEVGNVSSGTVGLTGGVVTFTPSTGFTGTATFIYTVSDGAATDTGTVTVTIIAGTNQAPVAVDDAIVTAEDQAATLTSNTLVGNDTDADSQTLSVIAVSNPSAGTVTLSAGTVTYVPAANATGTATFDYVVSDGIDSDTGRVTVTITPVNDLPMATAGTATTNEDTPVTITLVGTDTDGDALTFSVDTGPTAGTLGTITQVTSTTATVVYTPNLDSSVDDSFTFRTNDGTGLSAAAATVAIDVVPVNDRPVAAPITATINENTSVVITLTASDVDLPGQTLTFTISTAPAHATLGAITPATATTATVSYTPTSGYAGPDAFTFFVDDGMAISAAATVSITVNNVAQCNDGVIEAPETCDDQGVVGGDGCSATCQTETGWNCTGAPSMCDAICNDGMLIAGEEACDDGNTSDTDGCTTLCRVGQVCTAANVSLAAGDHFATDPATGHCYVAFDDEVTTFSAAQAACIASGGYLATITSAGEQARVASVQNTSQNPWIGAADAAIEGTFAWLTGEAFSFTHYEPGQPDNGGGIVEEDCLHLVSTLAPSGEAGRWNDTACDDAGVVGRVCELASNACGDGVLQPVRLEQCDDGNRIGFDGCSATCQDETSTSIFFSEYVEGSSGNNKAVEIYNPFATPFDTTGCSLRLYSNGATVPSASFPLTRTIASHDVLVVCHAQSIAAIVNACDVLVSATPVGTAVMNFNGDDALDLICGTTVVDSIGQVGVDPGSEWGVGTTSTADNDIRRKCSVTKGDGINNDAFTPSLPTQWGGFADSSLDFGVYTCVP